jgi:putative photosynthetic complex assembly protein
MNPPTLPADKIPHGLLMAMGALVLVSLAAVAAVRLSGVAIHSPDARAVLTRELRFEDRLDGSVAVIDARQNRELERVQGEAGFLRGALRALARERRLRDLGPQAPFELIGRADGRLTLRDPATGERVDLEAFGPTNAAVFARLLTLNPVSTPQPAPGAEPTRKSP